MSFLIIMGAVLMGLTSLISPNGALAAAPTAVILGGTGTPNPADEAGYIPNVSSYYIYPHSETCPAAGACTLQSFFTPETAWPLYGGLTAPTWKQSILQGYRLLDAAVRTNPNIPADQKFLLFGYSQSGAILALEKRALADDPSIDEGDYEIVVIGNVSRPNGGLNGRLPITVPIVEFPYGPVMPTDTDITTTDIAMKWDIIADAPLYVTNPLAMANALLGGPGFGIIHGTYPNPEGDPLPTDPNAPGPGGFTRGEWQAIQDDPEAYELAHPGTIDITTYGDTTYYTVTPKILPLVQPLQSIPVVGKPVADLVEPALRVIIEETGYDRSINPGVPTTFRLIPIFNPVKLAVDLVPAIQQGVNDFAGDLGQVVPATSAPVNTPAVAAKTKAPAVEVKDSEVKDSEVRGLAVKDEATTLTANVEKEASAVSKPKTTKAEGIRPSPIFRPLQRNIRDALNNLAKPFGLGKKADPGSTDMTPAGGTSVANTGSPDSKADGAKAAA